MTPTCPISKMFSCLRRKIDHHRRRNRLSRPSEDSHRASFNSLPTEIILVVYRYLLQDFRLKPSKRERPSDFTKYPPVLLISTRMHSEIKPEVLKHATVVVKYTSDQDSLNSKPHMFTNIRHIEIDSTFLRYRSNLQKAKRPSWTDMESEDGWLSTLPQLRGVTVCAERAGWLVVYDTVEQDLKAGSENKSLCELVRKRKLADYDGHPVPVRKYFDGEFWMEKARDKGVNLKWTLKVPISVRVRGPVMKTRWRWAGPDVYLTFEDGEYYKEVEDAETISKRLFWKHVVSGRFEEVPDHLLTFSRWFLSMRRCEHREAWTLKRRC